MGWGGNHGRFLRGFSLSLSISFFIIKLVMMLFLLLSFSSLRAEVIEWNDTHNNNSKMKLVKSVSFSPHEVPCRVAKILGDFGMYLKIDPVIDPLSFSAQVSNSRRSQDISSPRPFHDRLGR